jgi:hypothetical protein
MERKRRSEKMSKEEHKAFIKWVNSFDTKTDAVVALGISRPTLDNLIFKGSGKPDTIKLIREKLNS